VVKFGRRAQLSVGCASAFGDEPAQHLKSCRILGATWGTKEADPRGTSATRRSDYIVISAKASFSVAPEAA